MQIHTNSNFKKKDTYHWQFDILPSLEVARVYPYKSYEGNPLENSTGYWAINLQWLFWSITIII